MDSSDPLACAKAGKCLCTTRLDQKIAIITGGNAGIGFETAKALASRKCKLFLACRNEEKAASAVNQLKTKYPDCQVEYIIMDLNSLESVRKCAEQVMSKCDKIDILINNAGIMTEPVLTANGFDIHFQANHLGHFLFTNLLLDRIKNSEQGRIINVSSLAHKFGKAEWNMLKNVKTSSAYGYANAKLYNILFTNGLSQRLKGTNVTVNCLHPGVVKTNFGLELRKKSTFWSIATKIVSPFINPFMKTSEQGAQTSIHLALCPQLEKITGKYFSDLQICQSSAASTDQANIDKLWDLSVEYAKLNN